MESGRILWKQISKRTCGLCIPPDVLPYFVKLAVTINQEK
jgi:hypothetical protein